MSEAPPVGDSDRPDAPVSIVINSPKKPALRPRLQFWATRRSVPEPRRASAFVGLIPSEYSSGSARRQGGITKAGNGRARRALIEGAWAYRHPAKVSAHIQTRIDSLPKPIQDLGWKAQVRLGKRYRRLVARGKHPNVVVTAIARELIAFMWAIAKVVPVAA